MMSRDDMLRELELLPAWKLRAPMEAVLPKAIEAQEFDKVEVVEVEKPSSLAPHQYEITISQDKIWAFVCEMSMPMSRMDISLQGTLLNNILHALQLEKPTVTHTQNLADIDAKIIMAMGERVAQVLLNTQDALENLYGKLHAAGKTHIIATHDLAHLLNYPLDKAKVWQDLCLARSYLQNLHLQNLRSQD